MKKRKARETPGKKTDDAFRADIRALVRDFPFMAWLKDNGGKFVAASAHLADALDMPSPDAIIGKTSADLPGKYRDREAEQDDQSILTGKEHRTEKLLRKPKDGKWLAVYKIPTVDEAGTPTGLMGVAYDVNALKALEERLLRNEQNYQYFLDSLSDIVLIATLDGRLLYGNSAAISKLGYTLEQLRALRIPDIHPPESRETAAKLVTAVLNGERTEYPIPFLSADGRRINVQNRAWVGLWNGEKCLCCIAKDLTEEEEAQARFEQLFRHCPAPIAISIPSNGNRVFLDVNEAFLRLFGFTREEVIGKTPTDLCIFPELKQHERILSLLLEDGRFSDMETRLRRKNGRICEGLLYGESIPVRGKRYYLTILVDITERKQIEEILIEDEAKLLATIDNAPIGVAMIGFNNKFIRANRAFCAFAGYTEEELGARTISDIVHPEDLERTMKELVQLQTGGGADEVAQTRYLRKDGSTVYGEARMNLIRDGSGKPIYFLAVVADITLRKQAELELKKTASLRSDFTSMVSHELRTPLTAIMASMEIILDGSCGKINPLQRDLLSLSKRNADRLTRLINEVLDIQKLDAGMMKFSVRPADINAIVEETRRAMSLTLHNGVALETELDRSLPQVECDADKVAQVLANLVSNALKATDKGYVLISTALEDGHIRVSVEDTGTGIAPEDMPRLFHKFEQLEQGDTRKPGGTGLGLAICKEFIEKQGGKIWAESEPGKGTVFHFTLPAVKQRN